MGSGQTEQWNKVTAPSQGAGSTKPYESTGDVTMSWGGAGNYALVVVPIRPAATTPPTTYTITASVSGGHGTITPTSKTVNPGDPSGDFTITPDEGYHLASLTDNGADVTGSERRQVLHRQRHPGPHSGGYVRGRYPLEVEVAYSSGPSPAPHLPSRRPMSPSRRVPTDSCWWVFGALAAATCRDYIIPYGDQSPTQVPGAYASLAGASGGQRYAAIWALSNPKVGTADLTITADGSPNR